MGVPPCARARPPWRNRARGRGAAAACACGVRPVPGAADGERAPRGLPPSAPGPPPAPARPGTTPHTRSNAMAATTAPVSWAQRKDSVFLTINVPDVAKEGCKIDLQPTKLSFA